MVKRRILNLSKYEKLTDNELNEAYSSNSKDINFLNSNEVYEAIEKHKSLFEQIKKLTASLPRLKDYFEHETKSKFFSKYYKRISKVPDELEKKVISDARRFVSLAKENNSIFFGYVKLLQQKRIYFQKEYLQNEFYINKLYGGVYDLYSKFMSCLHLIEYSDYQFKYEVREGDEKSIYLYRSLSDILKHSSIDSDFKIMIYVDDIKNEIQNEIKLKLEDLQKIQRKIELILRARKKSEEKFSNEGYVYVLSNKAFPNIFKIGSTYSLPEERAEELTGTGNLYPFVVEDAIKIKDAEYYEKQIHKLFSKERVKKNREFFEIELNTIKEKLRLIKELTKVNSKRLALKELK